MIKNPRNRACLCGCAALAAMWFYVPALYAQSISGVVENRSEWLNDPSLMPIPHWHVAESLGSVVPGFGRVMVGLTLLEEEEKRPDAQPLVPTNMIDLVDLSTIQGQSWTYTLGSLLEAGDYRVVAWIDGNDNGIYDVGEPYGEAVAFISGDSSANNVKVIIRDDSDADGMEDWWEARWFADLSQTRAMDFDNDGLSNGEEYDLIYALHPDYFGINIYVRPDHWDTDGDGMDDAWEIFYGLDPTSAVGNDGAGGDPDGDGITNIDEYLGPDGIGPRRDINGDGIAEFTNSTDAMNPVDPDSDRDGVSDFDEFLWDLTHPIHPMSSTNFAPRSLRMDLDGGLGAEMTDPTGDTFALRTQGGTIEFWVYPETDGDGKIYSFPNAIAGQSHFTISLEDFRPKMEFFSGSNLMAKVGGVGVSGSIQQLEPGKWTHLAFTIAPQNKSISIRVNGVLLIAQQVLITPDFTGTPTICRDFADGFLDELRVWSYPRTDSDIQYWARRTYPAPGYVQQTAETRSGRIIKMYAYRDPPPLMLYLRFDDGGNAVENFAFLNHGLYPNRNSYRIEGSIVDAVTTEQAVPMIGSDDADGDELPEWWVDLYNLDKYPGFTTSAYGPEPIFCPEDNRFLLGFKYFRSFSAYGSIGFDTGWQEPGSMIFHAPKTKPDFYDADHSSFTKHVYIFTQPRVSPLNIYTPGMLSTIVYVNGTRVTTVSDEANTAQRYDIAQYMKIGRNTVHVECRSSTVLVSYDGSTGAIAEVPYRIADYQAYSSETPKQPIGCDELPYRFTVARGKFDAELKVNGSPAIVRGDLTRSDPRAVWHVQIWSSHYGSFNAVPMPDQELRAARTNPDFGVPLHAERSNNPLDPDSADDGLDAVYEYICGTNPRDRDTDNNGISDGDEDFDVDGLSNREEQRYGANPWLADTDDDGISDGLDVGDGHPAQSLSPQHNRSLRFGGGAGDFVEMPLQPRFVLPSWTVEAWIQPDADETDGGLLALRSVGGGSVNYEVGLNSNNFPYARYVSVGGAEVIITGPEAVTADGETWTHIAASYYDRNLKLYMNGTNVAATVGGAFPSLYAGGPLVQQIGTGFKGCIDEFRLWKTDVKEESIRARIDEVLTGLEEHLVAYYRFDDGTSATNRVGDLHVGTSGTDRWSWGQVEDNVLRYAADWRIQWENAASYYGDIAFSTNHIIKGPPRLQVYIENDTAISAGARWSHNGGASWNSSGYVETHLPVGEYSISFIPIDGWISPASIPLTLERGVSTIVTGIYVQTASLTIIIDNSSAIKDVATWSIDGNTTRYGSGVQVANLIPGAPGYDVLFSDISSDVLGWDRPSTFNIQLSEGERRSVSASYTPVQGSLQVNFLPDNAPPAARWRVSGNTNWWSTGEIVSNLAYGDHLLEYSSIEWWKAPADETIKITGSFLHRIDRTWEKLPEPSSVTVTLLPRQAVDAGALWGLDGAWYTNLQTVIVSPGTHEVSFKPIPGWVEPLSTSVSAINVSAQATGVYYRVDTVGSAERGGFSSPWGVAATPRYVYVSDMANHRVQRLDRVSGNWTVLGGQGTGTGAFTQPMGVALSVNGDLWVADAGNHRIQRLSGSTGQWTSFGSYGTGTGRFNAPYDVDIDLNGNVYVADYHNSRVQKRQPNGTWSVIIQSGIQNGRVRYPSGLAVDGMNQVLYVSDYDPAGEGFAGRVQKFSLDGGFLERVGTSEPSNGNLQQNMGLEVMHDQTLLVANTFNGQIVRRTTDGVWGTIIRSGIVARPRDVTDDGWGSIVLTDSANSRILVLPDSSGQWDAGYVSLGSGWRRLDSFGDYVPLNGNWFWHNRHGYFFVRSTSTPSNIYIFTQDMGWLFTRSVHYPNIFRFADSSWLWYLQNSAAPRWFFNLSTGFWEAFNP